MKLEFIKLKLKNLSMALLPILVTVLLSSLLMTSGPPGGGSGGQPPGPSP